MWGGGGGWQIVELSSGCCAYGENSQIKYCLHMVYCVLTERVLGIYISHRVNSQVK